MKQAGIYLISVKRHGLPDKMYVGQSVDIESRKKYHLWGLRSGRSRNPAMQMAFNKHGESSFEFSVLELCLSDKVVLAAREKHWLDDIASRHGHHSLYNVNRQEMTSALGVKRSEDTKRKISEAQKGRPLSAEALKNIRLAAAARKGIPLSKEAIDKRTIKQKGLTRSSETKMRMSEAMKGKCHSEEAKRKISETKKRLGQKPSAEHMEMLREMATGRKPDPEHIKRLADAKRGTKKNPEEIARRQATRAANKLAREGK